MEMTVLDQHKVSDGKLKFLADEAWGDVFVPGTSRWAVAPAMSFLDIENANSLDLVNPALAREIRKSYRESNDKVVLLHTAGGTWSSGEETAMEMWRALVMFTRAAMAGYGGLVKGNAMWVRSNDPGLRMPIRPLISIKALGDLLGKPPVVALLAPFQQQGVLDVFSRDQVNIFVGVRLQTVVASSAIAGNPIKPVLTEAQA